MRPIRALGALPDGPRLPVTPSQPGSDRATVPTVCWVAGQEDSTIAAFLVQGWAGLLRPPLAAVVVFALFARGAASRALMLRAVEHRQRRNLGLVPGQLAQFGAVLLGLLLALPGHPTHHPAPAHSGPPIVNVCEQYRRLATYYDTHAASYGAL
jgi:hypothetical protein